MNYLLTVAVFSQEMGNIPIRFTLNIPESLAKALMNTHVKSVKLAIAANVKPIAVGLDLHNPDGIKSKTESIEKDLPDRIDKDGRIDGQKGIHSP